MTALTLAVIAVAMAIMARLWAVHSDSAWFWLSAGLPLGFVLGALYALVERA